MFFNPQLHCLSQATKKLNAFADLDDDDIEMDDSENDVDSETSDFDDDLDPDKIEVPGEWFEVDISEHDWR